MEVRIGVQNAGRELTIDTDRSPEEIQADLEKVLTSGGLFYLEGTKGKRVTVPVDKLAYVEFGENEARSVGFGRQQP